MPTRPTHRAHAEQLRHVANGDQVAGHPQSSVSSPPQGHQRTRPKAGAWSPLRISLFRWIWIGGFFGNVGIAVQTVGAQWMLVHEGNAASLVSLVHTAQALPVLLLAMPAGVLADTFDRRRLLIAVQGTQTVIAVVLTVLTAVDRMTPSLLLTLTFALGVGAAVQAPAYQAMVPDLVPRDQIAEASAMASISFNLARAAGPAIAGVVIAHAGLPAVFFLNATCLVVFGLVLLRCRGESTASGGEPFLRALLTGVRYIRYSRVVRRILLRDALFVIPANVLWALLAVVARERLHLGAAGYGVTLAAVGVGSVIGALVLPAMRTRSSHNGILIAGSVVYASALLVVAVTTRPWLVILVLLPAGAAWMSVLTTLNASLQTFLPVWVRARGLAAHQVVFVGTTAGAAAAWGAVANEFGLTTAYALAAVILLVGMGCGLLLPLWDTANSDRSPGQPGPEPRLAVDIATHAGRVVVTTTYHVHPAERDQLLSMAPALRRMRLRNGGRSWTLQVDAADPSRYVERYAVASWTEHMLQNAGRLTGADREIEAEARALSDPPPEVRHLLSAPMSNL